MFLSVRGIIPSTHVAKLTFEVQDVNATLNRIEAMGLPLLRRPWGGTEAVDPEGNVFALRGAMAA
jgi:predicted enzyme related to lactoylglutathione lyase